jgi:dCMP deaminase
MDDKPEWWETREEKYSRVIHAEMNALLNYKEPVTGMTLYITHPPCENCAKHVAAAGIERVVFRVNEEINKRWNTAKSEEIFCDCGVNFLPVKLEEVG